jgi:hydroxymethylpyrimidine pyrophosphatase-like HAD family hydrolase
MVEYARELGLQDSYMISYNGAITNLKENKIIFEQTLTQEQIHRLYDYSVKHKTHIITYLNGAVVSETSSEYIDVELNITGLQHNKVDLRMLCTIICGKMYFAGGTFISENSREAFKSDDATFKCMYVKPFLRSSSKRYR